MSKLLISSSPSKADLTPEVMTASSTWVPIVMLGAGSCTISGGLLQAVSVRAARPMRVPASRNLGLRWVMGYSRKKQKGGKTGSAGEVAAVHRVVGPGHERRPFRGEPDHQFGHLLGPTQATDRVGGHQQGVDGRVVFEAADHGCVDEAGADRV